MDVARWVDGRIKRIRWIGWIGLIGWVGWIVGSVGSDIWMDRTDQMDRMYRMDSYGFTWIRLIPLIERITWIAWISWIRLVISPPLFTMNYGFDCIFLVRTALRCTPNTRRSVVQMINECSIGGNAIIAIDGCTAVIVRRHRRKGRRSESEGVCSNLRCYRCDCRICRC